MGDQLEVDTNALPAIIKSLGDSGRGAQDLVDDARDLVKRVDGLLGTCSADVSLAWTYIDRAAVGLLSLQRQVAVRAMAIAQSECNGGLEKAIMDAVKPPEKDSGGGWLGWVHTGLDVGGMVPVLGDVFDGANAVIYLGQGDWANAAISGIGLIPIGGEGATGARLAAKAIKGLRRGADDLEHLSVDVYKFGRHADDLPFSDPSLVDDAAGGLNHAVHDEHGLTVAPAQPGKKLKLQAGTDEHRAAAWERYQQRGGTWSYDRWVNSYEANIRNPGRSNAFMDNYRDALGWPHREVTVETPHGNRRIDIAHADPAKRRGVEHKTGSQYRSPANLSEIERDKSLVQDGWNIVWVFEKSKPSKPLLEELRKAGIPWVIE